MSILITGGTRGIGRAIASRLANRGETLVLTYRNDDEAAQAVQAELQAKGASCLLIKGDVTDETVCNEAAKAAMADGPIRVLVNNAGMTKDGLAMRMSEAQFRSVIDTNLTGAFLMSKAVLPAMVKARGGAIVNITSVAGIYGNAGQANYSASKAGLIGLTKTLSKELGSRNIRVNAVAPGFIETDMTAQLSEKVQQSVLEQISLGRFGQADDVAAVVDFLSSDAAAYITGQVLEVSGGLVI